jgi:serine/threonine protein phosphatase 1
MGKLYAISDIHGCYDTFYGLVISRICLQKSDRLILLGDYIDRGDKSREVIDLILDLTKKGYDVTPLMGNHESMMLDAYRDRSLLPLWLYNSGSDTLLSFGISDLSDMETRYIDFFMNLRYYEQTGDLIFVHAGFNDEAPDPFGDNYKMIWETRSGYSNPVFEGKTIIHGHRPKTIDFVNTLIKEKSRVIPIDTGCVYSRESGLGFLSALDVGSMQLISVSNY